ncbi:MAG: hypothetical protein UW19_C0005G0064 [Candidatus Moranbacteria bacterium GW2011_GWF2_44_10]|nr:MAG: hypothetical protein UW19_C0005G0064 [Candidatus Moranbacteria bacterium GW2011_GWF2_44_10]
MRRQFFSAEAKKTKRNYKTASLFNVSGDQTNADTTADYTLYGSQYRNLYRKISVPGLKISDPLPFRIYGQSKAGAPYPEGSWVASSSYSIADGYLYLKYGYGYGGPNWSYYIGSTGDYRLFTYYGGKSTKKTKRQCAQIFGFSVSGDASNADASIVSSSSNPNTTFHYRKIALKNLKLTNVPDYQIYKKDTYDPGLGSESWSPTSIYFFSGGYGWILYGYSGNGQFYSSNTGDFRLCFPEKISKKKSFAKRYIFSVSGDATNADVSLNSGMFTLYYRKVSVPGLKTDNEMNMRLMKKNNFFSGFSEESWGGAAYYTDNGAIYIMYGSEVNATGVFTDTGIGNYRLFTYK